MASGWLTHCRAYECEASPRGHAERPPYMVAEEPGDGPSCHSRPSVTDHVPSHVLRLDDS